MIDDGSPLSLDGIRAAAAAGRLADLARRLVVERRWSSLEVLLGTTAGSEISVDDAATAVVALCEALADLPAVDQREAVAELRDPELRAARALALRADREPLTESDRTGLGAAAALFLVAGESARAAALYEKAGDDESAAEIWGSLGELEKMEACLARKEARESESRRARAARRDFEAAFAAGERQAAIADCLAAVGHDDTADARNLVAFARKSGERLCRGRSVALRLPDGRTLRVGQVPAVLGRDPEVELPLREPTVSRRHARFVAAGRDFLLEDAGSRGGTALGGFPIAAPVGLTGRGEITLGLSCVLGFEVEGDVLVVRASGGIDRGYWAVLGRGPIDLAPLLLAQFGGQGLGLTVDFATGVARLDRAPGLTVRVAGQLIGRTCDLLHGDVIEVGPQRWEVV